MKIYKLKRSQNVNASIEDIWAFFSSPENLNVLTPPNMGFEILSPTPIPDMYQGQIIEYKVRPILNIPIYWKTEITEVSDNKFFVDEQLNGPYKLWRHKHIFSKSDNGKGVHMVDDLEYALPLGPLGSLAHSLYVKERLKEIFDYRYEMVEKIFNQKNV